MRNVWATSIFLFIVVIYSSAAKGETFAYKTIPLGSSVKMFLAKNPEFLCSKSENYIVCRSHQSTYGANRASQIKAEFFNKKLSSVSINFESLTSLEYAQISTAIFSGMIEKFGEPVKNKEPVNIPAFAKSAKMSHTEWRKNGDYLGLDTFESLDSNSNKSWLLVVIRSHDYDQKLENSYKSSVQGDL